MSRSTSITGDALQVKELLGWFRREGIEVTRVTVGSCVVDVAPTRAPVQRGKPRKDDRKTIYAQFGGGAIDELPEDLITAVGR